VAADQNPCNIGLAFVLDDEPKDGILICRTLNAVGIDARRFIDAEPFLSEVNRSIPDLVILDLALGKTDAVEVIRRLEVIKFQGKVLLVSGGEESTLSEVEQIGRIHALLMLKSARKPLQIDEIKERLLASPARHISKSPYKGGRSGVRSAHRPVKLAEALRNNWLEVWYQPKISLKSLTVCGAEALIRACHPDYGVIEPAELLPQAGDPLYKPLSFFVLRQAVADWVAFADRGFAHRLSINIPASILSTPEFVDLARRTIPRVPGFPGVIIEVTEDEFSGDPGWMREVATQLKLYNAWISLDDFGTAYSSLSRLADLPFIELKLDRSFVFNCAIDKRKHALCQMVVDLARRFGAASCAEGVETADDLQCVAKLGFDTAQGYFFAKAMPSDQFLEFFHSYNGRKEADITSAVGSEVRTRKRLGEAL
jgi:EAL domain-containing protein (putative c-di-GMP-specific phosphodiesterase class I)/ActR/RegA family two-component response regulator